MTPSTSTAHRPRLELSATQVVASVLAAVLATVAASYLGVTGTVVGAAVASAVTVIGNAVFGHGLHRTRDRVIPTLRPVQATATTPPELPARVPIADARRWRHLGIASLSLFAVILSALTTFELVTGRPISDLVRGDTGSGTTLFGANAGSRSTVQQPVRTETITVTQSVVVTTPTVTQTASPVTETTTPTVTSTPSSESPSSAPSTDPSSSPSP